MKNKPANIFVRVSKKTRQKLLLLKAKKGYRSIDELLQELTK